MNLTRRRRYSLVLSILLVLGFVTAIAGLTVTPADATAVSAPHHCKADGLDQELDLNFSVEIGGAAYVSAAKGPKLTIKATIPSNIVGLAALFGVKSASATGSYTLSIGGVSKAVPFVFPRTDIPQTAKAFTATITTSLPAVTGSLGKKVTYKTLASTSTPVVQLSLTGYNRTKAQARAGDDVGSVDAQCTTTSPNQTIGTATLQKSPTRVAASIARKASTKKVVSNVTLSATSGVVPTGAATATLYRGAKKVASKSVSLSKGRATAVFTGVKKRASAVTWKVVWTYGGNAAVLGSTGSRSVTKK
ncbi:hypothetical protein ABIE44_002012 [Marmoricola sp. OAE513]|uniref:hypothetical protein n=1 Tax=Marmoricola sp. OAE513 TaxID=2817894 RepID=UPI001AE26A78